MSFKSGFANENAAVRWERAPGPLREAAGFTYQEFSNLEKSLSLKGDPFDAGPANQVSDWAEFILLGHAKALAYYDHPFFGKWPAITRNQYGTGDLTYEGTLLSDTLQKKLMLDELKLARLANEDQTLPDAVRVKHGVNRFGRTVHYYFNYSSQPLSFAYTHGAANNLLTNQPLAPDKPIMLAPWGVAIAEETR
jgi:beta-galactosidase